MATSTYKVSRGSYLALKRTSGKDSDTVYFGYDGPNLGGIFVGDREITSTLKDAVLRVNPSNSRYLDLVLQQVDESGKMYKTAFKLFNTPVLEAQLTTMQSDITNLRSDVNDISTRLANLNTSTVQQFTQINRLIQNTDVSVNILESKEHSRVNWIDLD